MGSKRYPKGANVRSLVDSLPAILTAPASQHWNPYSGLFTQDEYAAVHVSNAAILSMLATLGLLARCTSWTFVAKFYLAPFLVTNHWCAPFTFLSLRMLAG